MKLSKILAGASLAALIAGNAHALGVTLGDADGTAAPNAIVASLLLAEESVYVAGDSELNGIYELTIATDGPIADGANLILGVSVQGGTFSTNIDSTAVTDGITLVTEGGEADGLIVTGANLNFGPGGASGQEGTSIASYLVSVDAQDGNNGTTFGLELPIAYGGCDEDLNIVISLRTEAGNLIEQGVVLLETPAVTCIDAFTASVTDDRDFEEDGDDFDSFLTNASNFSRFSTFIDDDSEAGRVGISEILFVGNDDDLDLDADVVARLDQPTPLDGSEVEALEFTVTVESDAGLFGVAAGDYPTEFDGNQVTLSIDANADPDFSEDVFVVVDSELDNPIMPQDVVASDVTLLFDNEDLMESEDGEGDTLDDINYEGVICGQFDWFGDANAPTAQVIRATGYGDDVLFIQAIIEGATDSDDDGVYLLPTEAGENETLITNAVIGAAAGDFLRANVSLNFVGSETSLDCDRLQVSGSGVVTPFGNGTSRFGDGDDSGGIGVLVKGGKRGIGFNEFK